MDQSESRAEAALRLACKDILKARAAAFGTRVLDFQIERLAREYMYQAEGSKVTSWKLGPPK